MRGRETRKCEVCDAEFSSPKARSKRTCSRACAYRLRAHASSAKQSRKVEIKCGWCSGIKLVSPVYAGRRFCSTRCSYNAMRGAGRAEYLPIISGSFHPLNGNAHVRLYGQEIAAFVNDAGRLISEAAHCMKFITSQAGLSSQNFASNLQTSLCCVASAIVSCIPKETRPVRSFVILIEITTPYTAIPWRGKPASQCPDGPRYKAIGNSMAVPVMRWIGERINVIEKLSHP